MAFLLLQTGDRLALQSGSGFLLVQGETVDPGDGAPVRRFRVAGREAARFEVAGDSRRRFEVAGTTEGG